MESVGKYSTPNTSEIVLPLSLAANETERQSRLSISDGVPRIKSFTDDDGGRPLAAGFQGVLRVELANRTLAAQELLLPVIGQNRFQTTGPELTLSGNWQIRVVARASRALVAG